MLGLELGIGLAFVESSVRLRVRFRVNPDAKSNANPKCTEF